MTIDLTFSTTIEAPQEVVFAYFEKEESLYRLAPPWEPVEVIHKVPGLEVGDTTHLKIGGRHWIAKITHVNKPHSFTFKQLDGPFHTFENAFIFEALSEKRTKVTFNFTLEPKWGFLGKTLFEKQIRKRISKLVAYRFDVIGNDLLHFELKTEQREKIIIAGASGFIGSHLRKMLAIFGYDVISLVRSESENAQEIFWDPEKQVIDYKHLEGAKAIINLCGYSIFSLRWTKKKKEKIIKSRLIPTQFLAQSIDKLDYPPKMFLSTSGIGFYGDTDKVVDETSKKGEGFLSDLAFDWEKGARECKKSKVIILRLGVVMGPRGGVIKTLRPIYRAFLGAVMGSGNEKMSWISLEDLCYQVLFILKQKNPFDVYNFSSSEFITSREFAKELAKALHRSLFFRAPRLLIKTLFKEASALFLSSCQAYPKNLLESGAKFSYSSFKKTLEHIFLP